MWQTRCKLWQTSWNLWQKIWRTGKTRINIWGYQGAQGIIYQDWLKLDEHKKNLYSFKKSFDDYLENMSFNNRFGRNIEAATWEIEATIEMKIDQIKADHIKTINQLDMKISSIASNKPSSYYEQPSTDLTKYPLIKSPVNLHMHHYSPKIYPPWILKVTLFFIFKNGGVPFIMYYSNPYQQKMAVRPKNLSC